MAIEISIEQQSKLFKQHFEEENNDRIIFSGSFGIGKTYFLDRFFAPAKKEYLAVKLSPVNYSVSANEDIFKLIKYDILFELMLHHGLVLDTTPEMINREIAYGMALPAKAQSIAEGLMSVLPILNKSAEDVPAIVAAVRGWYTIIQEAEKTRLIPGRDSQIDKFAEEVSRVFSLEADHVTSFLEDSLTALAETKGATSKVLIIDDLDRIDPEHIFRLFNIFSAHLDYHKSNRNKFGFDKVVFVCDIRNIKNIFSTRYGADTDFSGYIDKFYSKEIYYFDNTEEVKKIVTDLVHAVRFDEKSANYYYEHILHGQRDRNQSFLEIILTELVYSELLMVRRIVAGYGVFSKINNHELNLTRTDHSVVKDWQIPAAVSLKILHKILGGNEPMDKALRRVINYERSSSYKRFEQYNEDWLVGQILPIIDHAAHKFDSGPNLRHFYIDSKSKRTIGYNLLQYANGHMYYGKIIMIDGNLIDPSSSGVRFDFFTLLYEAFIILQKTGYLK